MRRKRNCWRSCKRWLLLALTCLGFALRLYRLGYPELRGDEAFGLLFSSQGIGSIVQQTLQFLEPHPPLDYALLHFWTGIVGNSEWAIRFTSLIFSVLAIPLIYQLGVLLDGDETGLWAALLLAVNPFQLWHAQEARMYAISAALGLASAVALLQAIRSDKGRFWVAYVLLSVFNAYTHYYALFLILAMGIYWLALWPRVRHSWRHWLAAQVGILLLYLPWLFVGWRVLTAYHGNGDSPGFLDMLQRSLVAFSVGQTLSPLATTFVLPLVGLLALIGLVYLILRNRPAALFIALYLGVPVLSVYLSSLQRPVFNERYLIAATPPFYVLLATGITGLPRLLGGRAKIITYIAALAIICASLYSVYNYFFDPAYTRSRGWRELAVRLSQVARPGDIIVQNYPDPTMWYYYRGDVPHTVVPAERPLNPDAVASALAQLGQRHDRVWFVPYKSVDWDADGFVTTWLDRHWEQVSEEPAGSFALRLYRPTRVSLANAQPSSARWNEEIALRGYRLDSGSGPDATLRAGDALSLTLFWEALNKLPNNYTVFVHLLAPDGRIVAQRDGPPLRGSYPTSAWEPGNAIVDKYVIMVPADASPGSYSLAVGLYDAGTGNRLAVATGEPTGTNGRYLLEQQVVVSPQ